MFLIFVYFIVSIATLIPSIRYIKSYFNFKKNGFDVEAKIVYFGPDKSWIIKTPKVQYHVNDKKFICFVKQSYISLLPNKIGSNHKIFVDVKNNENCIFSSKTTLIFEVIVVVVVISIGASLLLNL